MTLKTEVMMLKIQRYITAINAILTYITVNLSNISQYYCFYCICGQINAVLMTEEIKKMIINYFILNGHELTQNNVIFINYINLSFNNVGKM